MQQFVIDDKACEDNPVSNPRCFRSLHDPIREPCVLSDDDQMVWQLRVRKHQLFKSFDEANLILTGLEIAHSQNKWLPYVKSLGHPAECRVAGNWAKRRRHRDRHHSNLGWI